MLTQRGAYNFVSCLLLTNLFLSCYFFFGITGSVQFQLIPINKTITEDIGAVQLCVELLSGTPSQLIRIRLITSFGSAGILLAES